MNNLSEFYWKNYWKTRVRQVVLILLSLIILPVFSLLYAWPVQILWNWLMPALFGLPTITFWQAAGLMLLLSILFRGGVSIKTNEEHNYCM